VAMGLGLLALGGVGLWGDLWVTFGFILRMRGIQWDLSRWIVSLFVMS
jgi:hypothetical protein